MRLDSLTGLRWWAAFAVFCYHMMNFAPVPGLGAVARYGNHGVAFFFVLSGFVLTLVRPHLGHDGHQRSTGGASPASTRPTSSPCSWRSPCSTR